MRNSTLCGLLALALAVSASAAYADNEIMGPPWPPPANLTFSDKPPAPVPPDYPEDFSAPQSTSLQTAVYSAFGEDEAEPLSPRKATADVVPTKP